MLTHYTILPYKSQVKIICIVLLTKQLVVVNSKFYSKNLITVNNVTLLFVFDNKPLSF